MKTGQKVVCIKASETLIKNEIYTISEIIMNGKAVTLKEVVPKSCAVGFHIWRFRPIETEWVDELLRNIAKDELVSV